MKRFEVVMMTSHLHNEKDTNWYLDSRMTSHAIGDVKKFKNIKKTIGVTNIKSIGGHTPKVQHKYCCHLYKIKQRL
jgi:hypothetical protein